ncbi:putative dNA polymerase II, partial [Vibrio parahaemolyticus VP2007-007]
NY